jgi:hypothetical protein
MQYEIVARGGGPLSFGIAGAAAQTNVQSFMVKSGRPYCEIEPEQSMTQKSVSEEVKTRLTTRCLSSVKV